MRYGKQLFLAAFAAAALLWLAAPAEAQMRGRGGYGGGYRGGYGGGYGAYSGRGTYGYSPRYGYWNRPGFGLSLGVGGYRSRYLPGYSYGYGSGYGYLPGYSYGYGGYTPGYGYGYPNYGAGPIYVPSTTTPIVTAVATTPATRESLYYAPTTDNTARVRVKLPADATLWVAGQQMTKTGSEREFVTPALTPGSNYSYEMTAKWMADGRQVKQTRKAYVRANETTEVTFGADR